MPQATLGLAPDATSVGAARRVIRAHCHAAHADAAATDAATLLVSELVTNAVIHARTPLHLTVEVLGDRLHVAVRDRHPSLPRARQYSLDRATGRGLRLLETLASAWGVQRVTAEEHPGKVIWFELPLQTGSDVDDDELSAAFAQALDPDWMEHVDPL